MGHSCHECGMMCYCKGDIDDLDFGESYDCEHCDLVEIKCAKCGDTLEVLLHNKAVEGLAWCDDCIERENNQKDSRRLASSLVIFVVIF